MEKKLENILEHTKVRYKRIRNISCIIPIEINLYCEYENCLIIPHGMHISYGEDKKNLQAGESLFIPGGAKTKLRFGTGKKKVIEFTDRKIFKENCFKTIDNEKVNENYFTIIFFDAKILDAFEFFSQFKMESYIIPFEARIIGIINRIASERKNELLGFRKYLEFEMECLFIELLRNMMKNTQFVSQIDYQKILFQDERIIKVFQFIKDNLNKDLSNSKLADIALLSEDYITHFFKRSIGLTPQEFVENQRLEKSLDLIRNTKKSIGEISIELGFIDSPYFCKRFKLKYGIPPGKMRKMEE